MRSSGGSGGYSKLPAGIAVVVAAGGIGTSATLGNQTARLYPVYLPAPVTFTKLGHEVTVVGDAGSTITPLVYADDGTGVPGALVVAGTAVAGDVVGVNLGAAAFTAPQGWTWWGGLILGAPAAQPTLRTVAVGSSGFPTGPVARVGASASAMYASRNGLAGPPNPFAGAISAGAAAVVYGQT